MDLFGTVGEGVSKGFGDGIGSFPRLPETLRGDGAGDFGPVSVQWLARHAQSGPAWAPAPGVPSDEAHGIAVADRDRRVLKVNAAFSRITGYDSTDAVGRELGATFADDLPVGLHDAVWESVTEAGRWQGEIRARRKDGARYGALVTIDAVDGGAEPGSSYVLSIFAFAPVREALGRLHYLAHHDCLTGLGNRLLFWARLEQSIERARRHRRLAAVLFIDLDRFKDVNDRLGHSAGDHLLKCVAARLRGQVRGEDTVARLGGDEFGVIVEGLSSPGDARALARKLGAAVREPQDIDGIAIRARASIGIGLCPDDGETPEGLFKAADVAMYRAKRTRRRRLG